jgi:hypothetical protein
VRSPPFETDLVQPTDAAVKDHLRLPRCLPSGLTPSSAAPGLRRCLHPHVTPACPLERLVRHAYSNESAVSRTNSRSLASERTASVAAAKFGGYVWMLAAACMF